MIDTQTGPAKVRPNTLGDQTAPNTLRDQTAPNTFRNQTVPVALDGQRRNSGGGRIAPARRVPRLQLPLWVYVAVVVLAVLVALYVLNGTL